LDKLDKPESYWRDKLTPDQFKVTRKKGTERAGSGPLNLEKRDGTYHCVCCDHPLFKSEHKFESGTGWPSFFDIHNNASVELRQDRSLLFRVRTEVVCAKCDAHLGHVFEDGPQPSGKRYCMNSVAMKFTVGEP
jgi:peptide-methionine (R)-S-oxide reductase